MPFSHHSHSGQFCEGHAVDQLEEIVKVAIDKKMQVFAMTEHMPRHDVDRYPEELEYGVTLASQLANQAKYHAEAVRLREKYYPQIALPVGFESDWCRPESQQLIEKILADHVYDFYLGSVHHVRSVPIDYDHAMYRQVRDACGGTDEALFEAYFDDHYEMLRKLRPPVVAHFDLIRLKSDNPDTNFSHMDGVWRRILRNLDFIAEYGGIIEINTAALRKGMREPYPIAEICREFLQRKGRFCLSDDSHGIAHIATNYDRVVAFLHTCGIDELVYLRPGVRPADKLSEQFPTTEVCHVSLPELEKAPFWSSR